MCMNGAISRQARMLPTGMPCKAGIKRPPLVIGRDLPEVCHQQKGVPVHLPAIWTGHPIKRIDKIEAYPTALKTSRHQLSCIFI